MLKSGVFARTAVGVVSLLLSVVASPQGAQSGSDELTLLAPRVEALPASVPARYDFPELTEVSGIQPAGFEVSSVNVATMSNFRRAYFVDSQAFVLQLPSGGRYYLGVLEKPSTFTGRCARRPEALLRQGGTYVLSCGSKGMPIARLYLIEDSAQLETVTAKITQ